MGTLEKEKNSVRRKKDGDGSLEKVVYMSTKSGNSVDKRKDIKITSNQKKFLDEVKKKYDRSSIPQVFDLILRDFHFLERLRDDLGCKHDEIYTIIRDSIPESAYKKQIAIFNQFQDEIAPYISEDDLAEITQFFIQKINSNNGHAKE